MLVLTWEREKIPLGAFPMCTRHPVRKKTRQTCQQVEFYHLGEQQKEEQDASHPPHPQGV